MSVYLAPNGDPTSFYAFVMNIRLLESLPNQQGEQDPNIILNANREWQSRGIPLFTAILLSSHHTPEGGLTIFDSAGTRFRRDRYAGTYQQAGVCGGRISLHRASSHRG